MAFLAVVVFLALLYPQPVAARPAAAWMTSRILLEPKDDLTLCLGQQKYVYAKIMVETSYLLGYLVPTQFPSSFAFPPNQRIQAKSSNSNVASISPPSNTTKLVITATSRAVFQITAKKVGTSTITFSDNGHGNTGAQRNRPPADSETLTVTVKECGFRVVYFNLWPMPDGFTNPRMTSNFDDVIFPDDTGKLGPKDMEMENWLELTSRPGGGLCSYVAEAYISKVTLSGTVDWKANKLEIHLKFAPVKGKYDWTCPNPFRPIKVQKGLEDGQIDNQGWAISPLPINGPHAWAFTQSLTTHQRYTGHGVLLVMIEYK